MPVLNKQDIIPAPILNFIKKFIFRYTPFGAPNFPYSVEPIELATLVMEIDRLRATRGAIVEIGVARGMTTRFMVTHLISMGINDQLIYAIDTFSSFLDRDIEYEKFARGKKAINRKWFDYNDFNVWSRNFSSFAFVKPIQADCAEFDYSSLAPIKLALPDVDLYLPTIKALPGLYENLVEGGVILVDDVRDKSTFDGAYQAYMEFCGTLKREPHIIGQRCGIIRK